MSNETYTPFHVHTTYSLLDGFGSPEANAKRAKELGMTALGISDHGNVGGHVAHAAACKKYDLKPIFGNELYICHDLPTLQTKENRRMSHMVVWAKNRSGWDDLIRLTSQTNSPEYFYYKPRICLDNFDAGGKRYRGLQSFLNGNIQGFSGHQGSHLCDILWSDLYAANKEKSKADLKRAYAQYKDIKDSEYFRRFLRPDWLEAASKLAQKLEGLFGKGNFFIELQNSLNVNDKLALWIHPVIVDCLRQVSKATGIPAIASGDPHYAQKKDADDQRILVMNQMKQTEESVQAMLASESEQDVFVFFGSDEFYIHSYEEMSVKFTKEELEYTNKIAEGIEVFDITNKPHLPEFVSPYEIKSSKYLVKCKTDADKFIMNLAIEGARRIKPWESPMWNHKAKKATKEDYWNRLNAEMDVFINAGINGYFATVWDYCMAADNRPADHSFDWQGNLARGGPIDPIPRGWGRGSAGGCLVSYLINITEIDPIYYGLLSSRFYNEGRNTKDHVELPDIDTDFAAEDRDWVIDYIKHRYGHDKVSQMVTFQRMQGKASVKDLFRIKGVKGGFDLANELAKYIPSEAEVADELQQMRDAGHDGYGLIQWALDNSDELKKHYENPDIKTLLDQAVRLEGVKKGQGRHPSGVVIVSKPIDQCFPMVWDTRSKSQIIGVDMNDSAKMGAVKFDILGVAILDKMKMVEDLYNGRPTRRSRMNAKEIDYTEEDDE